VSIPPWTDETLSFTNTATICTIKHIYTMYLMFEPVTGKRKLCKRNTEHIEYFFGNEKNLVG
jgi:hypothetical protein